MYTCTRRLATAHCRLLTCVATSARTGLAARICIIYLRSADFIISLSSTLSVRQSANKHSYNFKLIVNFCIRRDAFLSTQVLQSTNSDVHVFLTTTNTRVDTSFLPEYLSRHKLQHRVTTYFWQQLIHKWIHWKNSSSQIYFSRYVE